MKLLFFAVAALAASPAFAQKGDEENVYYQLEEVSVPKEAYLEVGGMGFAPDGTLYICTRRGEIWSVKDEAGERKWRLFASGLHEPTGMLTVGNGHVVVAQRPELTRVRDTDGDGAADQFQVLTQEFGISGNYHEYHFGPVRDRKGNLYGILNLGHVKWQGHTMGSSAPYRGWAYKLTPKGEFQPFAVGFRSPAGIGISPSDEVFVTDNQGDWVATSTLYDVKANAFFGHPCSLRWKKGWAGPEEPCDLPPEELQKDRTMPVAWFPYGAAGHSPGQPVWDTTRGKFGPFAGQMLVGDQTKSFILRVALEKVGGKYQGAVFPFRRGFGSGILRMEFARDGSLWVGGTDRGWGATGGKPFALQRLAWTGKTPFEIATIKVTKTGFDLTFTQPVDKATVAEAGAYSLQHYHYRYWRTYGSPQLESTPVPVQAVTVSRDGRRVSLKLPAFTKGHVYELNLRGAKSAGGTPLLHETAYYTLNEVP